MSESKYIVAILIGVLIVATLLTGGLFLVPQDSPLYSKGLTSVPYEALFNPDKMMTINIEVLPDDWQAMMDQSREEKFVEANITINGVLYPSVTIRPKGNSSLSAVASTDSDRYSFKVDFNLLVKDQTCMGLDKMVLNNLHADTTMMKDYMAYKMMTEMGVPTPLFAYADVSLNGEPWGCYLAVESPDASFAQRQFGASFGQLYNVKSMDGAGVMTAAGVPPKPTTTTKPAKGGFGGFGGGAGADLRYTDDDYYSYIDIFGNSSLIPTTADYDEVILALKHLKDGTELETYFDVDEILRYFAVHNATVNFDSYTSMLKQNYFLYEDEGKLSMLPWDYNMAFGCFESKTSSSVVNFPIDTPLFNAKTEERPMYGQLMKNETYVDQYHQYMQELLDKFFNSEDFAAEVDKVDRLISDCIEKDPTKFFTFEQYKIAIVEFKELGALRAESIQGQLNGSVPATTDGQTANPDALIDASAVDLPSLGLQFSQMFGSGGMR